MPHRKKTFIDLCAGCGGLSLGLMKAGWKGLFAVEKNDLAFKTLSHNLIEGKNFKFDWPEWLPKKEISIESLLSSHERKLTTLRGKVDLLAGGPPCQGFSTVGKRVAHDPRNQVFRHYMKLVNILEPDAVVMENVRGILYRFKPDETAQEDAAPAPAYAEIIQQTLEELGYQVWHAIVHAKDFGVPQTRPRFILVGIRKEARGDLAQLKPFKLLSKARSAFLYNNGLPRRVISVEEALSDLRINPSNLQTCIDSPRFLQGAYGKPTTDYQRLMHGSMNGALADSHRLAHHRAKTVEKFQWFLDNCTKGSKIAQEDRGDHANKKHTIYLLEPTEPAPTVTTLPDDILHYAEPRILTVREMARLQSFPDWFEFKGKYTTGGTNRVKECPRYTQVGNAVPPLLAEALGGMISNLLLLAEDTANRQDY